MVDRGGDARRSKAAPVWNAIKILLVFCAAGPLFGLIVFAAGLSLITIAGGQPDGFWIGPFLLLYGIVFAHLIGLPWAALAGAAAAGLAHVAGPKRWIGLVSGVASFAIAAASGNIRIPVASAPDAGSAVDSFEVSFFGLMAAVHIVSAIVCWLIARPLIGE